MNDAQRARKAGSGTRLWLSLPRASLIFLALLPGCDIVQGFQDAGDTLFPEESTHLGSPGLRLVRGNYWNLGVAVGSELYLLARVPEDATSSLYSMRYASPSPCAIPNVGRFATSRDPGRSAALVAYFADFAGQGLLRFADTSCRTYALELPDARMPSGETERGLVIWAGNELLLVDPTNSTREILATGVTHVISNAFLGRHVVLAGGRIGVFRPDWTEPVYFSEKLAVFGLTSASLVYEDATGVHRLTASMSKPGAVDDTLIAAGACALGIQDDTWVTYRAPCTGTTIFAYRQPTNRAFELPFQADSRFLKLVPPRTGTSDDPTRDGFWFFHLRDFDPSVGLGTLSVRNPAGEERELGTRAVLERAEVVEPADATLGKSHGYGLVDLQGDRGTYVYWDALGARQELARNVFRWGRRLITDFDGTQGDLAVPSGNRLALVATGVPVQGFEIRDRMNRWTGIFHGLDGASGKLSVLDGLIDGLERRPADQPLPDIPIRVIAPSIGRFGVGSLGLVMPGLLYLSNYDPDRGTGRLEYRNLELGFTAFVNYAVSDYLVAKDEVLYAVPRGEGAGIWIVQGK